MITYALKYVVSFSLCLPELCGDYLECCHNEDEGSPDFLKTKLEVVAPFVILVSQCCRA